MFHRPSNVYFTIFRMKLGLSYASHFTDQKTQPTHISQDSCVAWSVSCFTFHRPKYTPDAYFTRFLCSLVCLMFQVSQTKIHTRCIFHKILVKLGLFHVSQTKKNNRHIFHKILVKLGLFHVSQTKKHKRRIFHKILVKLGLFQVSRFTD